MKYVAMIFISVILIGIGFVVKTYLIIPYPSEVERNDLQKVVYKERELCSDCLLGAIWISVFISGAIYVFLYFVFTHLLNRDASMLPIAMIIIEGVTIYITYRTIESRKSNDYTITI